jgi:disulfide oxidoreductase YuzD
MQFGPAIAVEYIDLADPQAQEEHSELLAVIEDRDLPYPLVAINGQLRLAGSVQYYRILPLVQEILEEQITE